MSIPSQKKPVTVDAIVCYHKHKNAVECVKSLKPQVRQIITVDDGSGYENHQWYYWKEQYGTVLHREKRHGVANSFNYGAFHSNADYFLYVDPHCTFKPKAVANLVKACGTDYDFAWGTGSVAFVTEEPYKTLLRKSDRHDRVNLCFLIKHTLWESMKGIPEPPHCHMDVLADELLRTGTMVAQVHDVCHHQTRGGLFEAIRYYYSSAKSYGLTAQAGYAAGKRSPIVQQAQRIASPEVVAQLLSAVFASIHAVGAIEGLGLLPEEALPMVQTGLSWKEDEE